MTETNDLNTIKIMLKKGREKLKTAKINFENERFDDSVSRSYYAIFHFISAMLMSKQQHYSSHKGTINAFNKEFIKTGICPQHFAKTIQTLFIDRQKSDYDFNEYICTDVAGEDLKKVEEILESCEHYLANFYNVPKESLGS